MYTKVWWTIYIGWIGVALIHAESVPQMQITNKVLEMVMSSKVSWGLESLFTLGSLVNLDLREFTLEGKAPCQLEEPRLALTQNLAFRENVYIEDFSVIDQKVYYMTREAIKSFRFTYPFDMVQESLYEIHNVTGKGYTYLDVFWFTSGDTCLFFKGTEAAFTYGCLSPSTGRLQTLHTTQSAFQGFKDPMKISTFGNFVLIPAGSKGLFVYIYQAATQTLEPATILFTNMLAASPPDVRDVALNRDTASEDSLLMFVADYNQGLYLAHFNTRNFTMLSYEKLLESTKAKSVSCVKQDQYYKITVVADADQTQSKLIVLSSFFAQGRLYTTFDQIKILDGLAQASDADGQYAAVLMPNSLLITRLRAQTSGEMKYVNNPGICHAKLYRPLPGLTSLLVYTRGNDLVSTQVDVRYGSLVCSTDEVEGVYEFSIGGLSSRCAKFSNGTSTPSECIYMASIELHVTANTYAEAWSELKFVLYIFFSFLVAVLIAVVIILIIFIIRYRRTQDRLKFYESLDKREVPAKVEARPPQHENDIAMNPIPEPVPNSSPGPVFTPEPALAPAPAPAPFSFSSSPTPAPKL